MGIPAKRLLILAAASLLVVVAIAGYTMAVNDEAAELAVENQHTATYQVTAFQPPANSSTGMRFEVTKDDGTRKVVGLQEITSNTDYRNVTLVDAASSTMITVTAGQSTTRTLADGASDSATAYVVETTGGELRYANAFHCSSGAHGFNLRITPDGRFSGSVQCR